MSRLEELKEGASVRGILPNQNVTVIATKWHGDGVITLTFRDANGRPIERLLYRHDEPAVEVVTTGRPWSFDADGGLLTLVAGPRAAVRREGTKSWIVDMA